MSLKKPWLSSTVEELKGILSFQSKMDVKCGLSLVSCLRQNLHNYAHSVKSSGEGSICSFLCIDARAQDSEGASPELVESEEGEETHNYCSRSSRRSASSFCPGARCKETSPCSVSWRRT